VDRIDHLPPALALRQRPPVPGPRSTVGTMSEVLNVLRLMMSRMGSHGARTATWSRRRRGRVA
jgi:excinuclease ABC subunit A